MSEQAPGRQVMTADLPELGTDVEDTTVIGEVEYDGTVTSVSYTPEADITGAATNHRSISVINKGLDGNGTTVVATLAFDSGVNASDFDEKAITLSVVEGATDVLAGQILACASLTPGSGIADPGGTIRVEISRGAYQ